jgi:hypothetical protein
MLLHYACYFIAPLIAKGASPLRNSCPSLQSPLPVDSDHTRRVHSPWKLLQTNVPGFLGCSCRRYRLEDHPVADRNIALSLQQIDRSVDDVEYRADDFANALLAPYVGVAFCLSAHLFAAHLSMLRVL